MEIRYLLKSQANQVFQAIKNAELEPADFEWQETKGHESGLFISMLVHKTSGYYFSFDNYNEFSSIWSPGKQTLVDMNSGTQWKSQLTWFQSWLTCVKREKQNRRIFGLRYRRKPKFSNPPHPLTPRTLSLRPRRRPT